MTRCTLTLGDDGIWRFDSPSLRAEFTDARESRDTLPMLESGIEETIPRGSEDFRVIADALAKEVLRLPDAPDNVRSFAQWVRERVDLAKIAEQRGTT